MKSDNGFWIGDLMVPVGRLPFGWGDAFQNFNPFKRRINFAII
jgi:hypothetical protein